jgi:pectinesterase
MHRDLMCCCAWLVLGLTCELVWGEQIRPIETSHQDAAADIVVATDGTGDVSTVQAALDQAAKAKTGHCLILIKRGTYHEKVRIDTPGVILRGEDRLTTKIEYPQLNDEFEKQPDQIGKGVINSNADDLVIENLTITNTAGIVGPHAFAIYGIGDRVVIQDCQILSEGADTVSLWRGDVGRYYHARCHFRGAVDFVCPRGWCYITDCTFYETKATAAIWHDGHQNEDMKFVLRNCKFDGVERFVLGRHHVDAQIFLLDCQFSKNLLDRPIQRVVYPIGNKEATDADRKRNAELDLKNRWGERAYFSNCHHDGGDFAWHADNLWTAQGAPQANAITPAWTFAGTWDPTSTTPPKIEKVHSEEDVTEVVFSQPVTVKGSLQLQLADGGKLPYQGGSGSTTLRFGPRSGSGKPGRLELESGEVVASRAHCQNIHADLALP